MPPWLGWPLWNICVTNDYGYKKMYVPLVRPSRSFLHSWLITGLLARLRRMPLVGQELLTIPEHMSSPPVFSEVRVTRSLVLCVLCVDRCLSFYTFSFGHCVVCPLIYGFWLPLWYLLTPLTDNSNGNPVYTTTTLTKEDILDNHRHIYSFEFQLKMTN